MDKNTNRRKKRKEEGGWREERRGEAAFTPVSSASLIGQSRPQQRRAVLRLAESCMGRERVLRWAISERLRDLLRKTRFLEESLKKEGGMNEGKSPGEDAHLLLFPGTTKSVKASSRFASLKPGSRGPRRRRLPRFSSAIRPKTFKANK